MKHIIIFLVCIIGLSVITNAQPGTLDESFGTNGIALIGKELAGSNSLATQQDGKTVTAAGGYSNGMNGFALSRINKDGGLDMTFGNEGYIFTGMAGLGVNVESVRVQDDGKIIAAGYNEYQAISGVHFVDIIVIRYNEDGTIDNNFGVNGIAFANVGIKSYTTCMTIQPDGKIIVAGYRRDNENDVQNLFILRLLSEGILDESFGNDGILLEFFSSNIIVNDILVQPEDGKILVGGMYTASNQGAYFLIRYLSDGTRNNGFGNMGEAQIQFGVGSSASILNQIALQTDGKIVAAGRTYNPSSSTKMTVVRFKTNGTADENFGEKGIVNVKFGEDRSEAKTLIIQEDEKIIIAGYRYPANYSFIHFALARLKNDGNLDSTFGINGQTTDVIINDFTAPDAGILQKNNKLILGATDYTSAKGLILVRYNTADAILPITYNKFTAEQSQQYITLNWQTATELNNRYFAIERSSNAVNYAAIAQVNSAGTGATVHEYNFTDRQPVQGTNYYRLKQTDADGKYSYSKVVSINYIKPGTILLLPNPAKDQLTVKGLNASNVSTISLLDIQGKLIQQFTAKQLAAYSFNISNLSPGTYMVRVKDNNGVVTQKFVKQ